MKVVVKVASMVLRYVIWLALFALGLVIIQVLRGDLFNFLVLLHASGYAIPTFVNFFVVITFVAWLAAVIWLESYLTEPPTMSVFWQRLRRVLLPMGVILAISYLIEIAI